MVLSEIRNEARALLQGRWVNLVPVWFVYFIVVATPSVIFRKDQSAAQFGFNLIIGGPFAYAVARISLRLFHREEVVFGQLFEGFKDFSRNFIAYFLVTLYTVFWTLLLIVPGIIAALGYSMTFFIMAEDPAIRPTEAMRHSKELMMGHKMEFALLGASFLGWLLLSILTVGIGLLWLESYIMTSYAIFYQKVKGQAGQEEVVHILDTKIEEDSIT